MRGHPRVPRAAASEVTQFIARAQRIFRTVAEHAAQRTSTEVVSSDLAAASRLACTIAGGVHTSAQHPEPPLQVLLELFAAFERHQVHYCHWKSNATLDRALAGEGDLDLLVDPADWTTVRAILDEHAFLPAHLPAWQARPGAAHYFGMDALTGRLVHLDVYLELLTGGTLLKNHRLPLEELVTGRLRRERGVPVPSRGAELLLLVLRKMLECASSCSGWRIAVAGTRRACC
jgi:hypothetical protein